MNRLTNPTEIAREALRQLAQRRVAPTPDNYRQLYLEIADPEAAEGRTPRDSAEAPDWAQLIHELLRQWDSRRGRATLARKREGLEALLRNAPADPAVFAGKLRRLIASWSDPEAAGAPAAEAAAPPAAPGPWHELLAQTLEFAVASQLGHAPDLSEEALALAKAARAAAGPEAAAQLAGELKRFWYKLEMRGGEHAELHQGLLRLLRLMIDNTAELLPDDRWLNGQIALLQTIVSQPLSLRAVGEAEKQLKEVIYKQGVLRGGLRDAQAALKQMVARFIERLGELSASTGQYHVKLEGYAERIRATDGIAPLNALLEDLMRDTREVQLDALRARDELAAAEREARAAEQRVRELEAQLAQVSELVREDQLTKTLNRRGLEDAFAREAGRADRQAKPLCVALLDIDNFKHLNDAHGHQAGDEALTHLVRVVKRTMRPSDVLARYGGEEFMLLLPETGTEEAVQVMTRLQRNLTKAFFLHNNERVLITFSAGVAQRAAGEPNAEVVARADKALYEAKQSGKNRVRAAAAAAALPAAAA